jgi:hypothetical protein
MCLRNNFRLLLCLLFLAIGLTTLPGCDPVRTIEHEVKMAVTDEHGLPAPDVNVSIKESWESWQTWGGGTSESEKSYLREKWGSDFVPWRKGVTDAQGKAAIRIRSTGLDRTRGDTPPANRDAVSNRDFLIKLQKQNDLEELRVVMKPGATAAGKRYAIKIEEIEKPRYVPTNDESKRR